MRRRITEAEEEASMEEFNLAEIINPLLKTKSDAAIQCAKVARLIPDIDRFVAHEDESAQNEFFAELKRELIKLEIEMVNEREKNRKPRLGILDIKWCTWMVIFFCFTHLCFVLFYFFSRY